MNDFTDSRYIIQLREKLNQISENAYEKIANITELPPSEGLKILRVLLENACLAQNVGVITLAREKIKEIQKEWLINYLSEGVEKSINLEDEWEYRRLLELLIEILPELFNYYINIGLCSDNIEVAEVARDFLSPN